MNYVLRHKKPKVKIQKSFKMNILTKDSDQLSTQNESPNKSVFLNFNFSPSILLRTAPISILNLYMNRRLETKFADNL